MWAAARKVGSMKVVVCFKNVPDEREAKIDAQRNIDFSKASLSIGTYDLNAVEAGTALLDADEAIEYVALTAGDSRSATSKLKKDVLARGPQRLVVVQAEGLSEADCLTTAQALAWGIRQIGDVDIVLFGEGSGDRYNQEVGLLVGALLGWPALNGVSKLEVAGAKALVERSLENVQERLSVSLPCALSVTSDINTPRISGMKAILSAGKKPMDVLDYELGEPASELQSLKAPEKVPRRQVLFEDDSDGNVEEFFQILRKAL